MTITYRRAVPADAAHLAEFAPRAFRDTYAVHNSEQDMRAYIAAAYGTPQQMRELCDPQMITVLAVSDGDVIVGYAQLRRKGFPPCVIEEAPVEIYRFYVDRSAQGTGVAANLMAEALDAARELGGAHAWLGVWEKNTRAIAFYKKHEFRDVGSQIFHLGADAQTDRVLIRRITAE